MDNCKGCKAKYCQHRKAPYEAPIASQAPDNGFSSERVEITAQQARDLLEGKPIKRPSPLEEALDKASQIDVWSRPFKPSE